MTKNCAHCAGRAGTAFTRPFTMAFQPIWDLEGDQIFAHEALLRTPEGGSAAEVLSEVTDASRYSFDQACRTRAIELARRLGIGENLSINFMPNAVYDPDTCIERTLWAADRYEIAIESIIFEFTEGESVRDVEHLRRIVALYRDRGFWTALDDFGAGYAGLSLLAEIQPDILKLDMILLRGVHADFVRQTIIRKVRDLTATLGITLVAEGVETLEELDWLRAEGIRFVQGYGVARPRLEGLVGAEEIRQAILPLRMAG